MKRWREAPNSIKVIGLRYRIRQVKNLRLLPEHAASVSYVEPGTYHEGEPIEVLGLTDSAALLIVLESETAEARFKTTLVHEMLHAMAAEAGLRDVISSDVEESVVKRMAPILTQVLTDNPGVYTYVTGRRLW